MKRKIGTIALSLVLTLSLTACTVKMGKSEKTTSEKGSENVSSLTNESKSESKSEEKSEAKSSESKSEEKSEAKSSESKSEEKSEAKSSESKSEEKSEEKSSESKSEEKSEAKSSESKSEEKSEAKSSESKSEEKSEEKSSESKSETKADDAALGSFKPEKAVEMIVAYKAGSGTDTTARVLSKYATETIGQTIVIQNQEGGSGSIGWTALAKAKNDGYTLGFVNLPTLASNIVEGLGSYKIDDFTPICNHVKETSLVLVSKSSPYKTLEDLVKFAKENPGKLKASTNGKKASNHIGAQLLAKGAGFEYKAIAYGGTADQLLALRQGEVDFSVAKEADIKSMESDLRVLGVFDKERMKAYPDAPTLKELGYYDGWYGSSRVIVGPKDMDPAAVKFYAEAFRKAMENPEYIKMAEQSGVTTVYMSPEETKALIEDQYKFVTETVSKIWD